MQSTSLRLALLAAGFAFAAPAVCHADDPDDRPAGTTRPAQPQADHGPAAPFATTDADHPESSTPEATASTAAPKQIESLSLLDAMHKNLVTVSAEGSGDGRMILSIKNKSRKSVNVVLPPGLVAQGATGQMGGMMGGMGGGMGGMGGGMGGMGGGMGGMGGGMGGMGGGMMGGGMGGMGGGMVPVMPARMGMMMLGRLIMTLIERDSWDMTSLMMGMGGMGGGMGGMGGGMGGGMSGMGGGMGGGMRSIPPTGLPNATFKPGQTRELPTRLVSLNPPDPAAQAGLAMPAKGEKLRIGDVGQINDDPRLQKALKRLAALKAPQAVAQLVLWKLNSQSDWDSIVRLSQNWANAHELTLARDFVDRLDAADAAPESGTLHLAVSASSPELENEAAAVRRVFESRGLLGLKAVSGLPEHPDRPSVGFTVRLGEGRATVDVVASDAAARSWVPFGKFTLPLVRESGALDTAKFCDGVAEGVLNRLVRAQLSKGPRVGGKETYRLRVDNASPLVLNGLGILGASSSSDSPAKVLPPLSLGPRRSVTLPASEAVVRHLELKKGVGGVHVSAADFSGL